MASTRSRRTPASTLALEATPNLAFDPKLNTEPYISETDGVRGPSHRRVLFGMDPNTMRSPSPTKPSPPEDPDEELARTPAPSTTPKGASEQIMAMAGDGDSFSLPDFAASFDPNAEISGLFDEALEPQIDDPVSEINTLVDVTEEEALADVPSGSARKTGGSFQDMDIEGQSDFDFTYIAATFSYTSQKAEIAQNSTFDGSKMLDGRHTDQDSEDDDIRSVVDGCQR